MSATRILILGLLDQLGPMHGHHLRRRAEIIDVGQWAEVSIGSLYSTLHRMEDEGLIASLRRERSGNYPARTVYTITDEGREELKLLRDQALERLQLHADPVDMALAASGGCSEADIRLLLEQRRRAIETRLAYDHAQRERMEASGTLMPRSGAVFRHWELRLEAELQWHREVEMMLPEIVTASASALRRDLVEGDDAEEGTEGLRVVELPVTDRPRRQGARGRST
jgi:DNA-binding PadR family transcriptional regulator